MPNHFIADYSEKIALVKQEERGIAINLLEQSHRLELRLVLFNHTLFFKDFDNLFFV